MRHPFLALVFAIISISSVVLLIGPIRTEADNNYYLNLQISNPYTLALELEVKCDWQPDREKYKYYRKIYIPRKTITNLSFPHHLKTCELWPRIDW
jgi:hypothetical protein